MYLYVDPTSAPRSVYAYRYSPNGTPQEGQPQRVESLEFATPIRVQCEGAVVQIGGHYPGVFPALVDLYSKRPSAEMMPVLAFAALTQTLLDFTPELRDAVKQTAQIALVYTTDGRIGTLSCGDDTFVFEAISEPQYLGSRKPVTAAEVAAELAMRVQVAQAKLQNFADDPVRFLEHFNHFMRREPRSVPMY